MPKLVTLAGFLFDLTAQLGYNIKVQAFSKGDRHEIPYQKRFQLEMALSRHGREAVAALARAGRYLH